MEVKTLGFFIGFKCAAAKCRHNCCTGWQIDVDDETLKKYKNYKGGYGKTLLGGVDFTGKRFRTTDGKRCAFLNKDNLCDLIINLGEDYLCDACREHPRYRNYLSDRMEYGVGVCCEESAKAVINYAATARPVTLCDDGETPVPLSPREREFEKTALAFREKALGVFQNRDLSFNERVCLAFDLCGVSGREFLAFGWKDEFLKLERLGDGWRERIENADFTADLSAVFSDADYSVPFEQLAAYFIHRHVINAVDNTDLKSRLLFCVLSLYAIYAVFTGERAKADGGRILLADVAREYSAQVEYSDENVNALLDLTDRFAIKPTRP